MVAVKINGVEYQVVTEWSEVDADKLKDCKDFKDELKCLTTITHEIIDKATEVQLFPIYTLLSFIDDIENMPLVEAQVSYTESGENKLGGICFGPYDDFETAKGLLKEGKPYKKIIKAARVYYPKEKDTVRLIGLGVSIVSQISIFLQSYQDMITSEPEGDEVNAGIHDLTAFSYWGTAYALSGEDVLMVNEVLKKPTIEIYTALYYGWRKSRYQKRLFDIQHPKKIT